MINRKIFCKSGPWSKEGTVRYRQSKEASILLSHREETRELPRERGNARNNARCTQARKTTHGLDGQHQDVDRTPRGRLSQSDRGRDKLQILSAAAFLFSIRTDSTDSPDCLPILLSISVFYFLVFLFFHLLVVGSRTSDLNMTLPGAFSALTLLVVRQEGHPVVCLERVADLHMFLLMPLPLTVSCFSKIRFGFTFLVPTHLVSPGKRPLNGCVLVVGSVR